MTDAERTLLLLLADALWEMWTGDQTTEMAARVHNAADDVRDEARADRQNALQAGQGASRSSGGETLDAVSDAHRAGKWHIP